MYIMSNYQNQKQNTDVISDMGSEFNKYIEWSVEKEVLLVEWADIAHSML